MKLRTVFASLVLLVPAVTAAQPAPAPAPADDGYCDFVEGAASATAATLYAPQVFGQFGYIEQPVFGVNPAEDPSNLRVLGGLRWSLSNIYTGTLTKSRASAECRRHNAIAGMRGVTTGRAVAARVAVYDSALPEAEKLLQTLTADLEARRTTLQEATAMRLRVEQLRGLAGDARRELAALPPQDQRPLAEMLTEFRSADAAVEKAEGKLRTAQAYDFSVRFGIDRFLEGPQAETRYFGVVQLGINLGAFFTGSGNSRAAAGRARYSRSGNDPLVASTNATVDQMRALIELDSQRATQAQALVNDLAQQLEALSRIATEDAVRMRQTLWFDWVKAKADLAYLQAHVEAMQQIVGAHAQAR